VHYALPGHFDLLVAHHVRSTANTQFLVHLYIYLRSHPIRYLTVAEITTTKTHINEFIQPYSYTATQRSRLQLHSLIHHSRYTFVLLVNPPWLQNHIFDHSPGNHRFVRVSTITRSCGYSQLGPSSLPATTVDCSTLFATVYDPLRQKLAGIGFQVIYSLRKFGLFFSPDFCSV